MQQQEKAKNINCELLVPALFPFSRTRPLASVCASVGTGACAHTSFQLHNLQMLGHTVQKHLWKLKLRESHISVAPFFSSTHISKLHTCYCSFSTEPALAPPPFSPLLLRFHASASDTETEPQWRSKYLLLFVLTLEEALESYATLLFRIVLLLPIVKLPLLVCCAITHLSGSSGGRDWVWGAESSNFAKK